MKIVNSQAKKNRIHLNDSKHVSNIISKIVLPFFENRLCQLPRPICNHTTHRHTHTHQKKCYKQQTKNKHVRLARPKWFVVCVKMTRTFHGRTLDGDWTSLKSYWPHARELEGSLEHWTDAVYVWWVHLSFFFWGYFEKKKEECLKCSVEKENCLGHIVVNLPLLVKCCLRERWFTDLKKKGAPGTASSKFWVYLSFFQHTLTNRFFSFLREKIPCLLKFLNWQSRCSSPPLFVPRRDDVLHGSITASSIF